MFSHNLGQKIRKRFHVLAQIIFIKKREKMELEYSRQKVNVGVVLRVAE